MKKLLFISLLCTLLIVPAVAQEKKDSGTLNVKPNLSGIWIPQIEKDSRPGATSKAWTTVTIAQTEQDLKFTIVYPQSSGAPSRELKYFIDERGETNDGMIYYYYIANGKEPEKKVKSTTKWDGPVLVTIHKMVFREGAVTVMNDVTMRWQLSADGKTLTRTTTISNFSAEYGDRVLPVTGATNTESKDTFFLLESKP